MPIGQYIISRQEGGFTHAQALALAVSQGGTLAAVTSVDENNLFNSILHGDSLLTSTGNGFIFGCWIGLTQTNTSSEPGGGWTWDTGEGSIFSAWIPGQPDNFLGDSFAVYASTGGTFGWGDHVNNPVGAGFAPIVSAAVELADGRKTLNGTVEHDFIWAGAIGNVIRSGGGDDIVQGNGGRDKVLGGGGNDSLDGGNGADTLTGGTGADTQTGGAGADQFIYLTAAESRSTAFDVIEDFTAADVIDLSALTGTLTFKGSTAFDGLLQVRVDETGPGTRIEVNLTGNSNPEMVILLTDDVTLTGASFAL